MFADIKGINDEVHNKKLDIVNLFVRNHQVIKITERYEL